MHGPSSECKSKSSPHHHRAGRCYEVFVLKFCDMLVLAEHGAVHYGFTFVLHVQKDIVPEVLWFVQMHLSSLIYAAMFFK